MKTVTINLYTFDELSNESKTRAIEKHREFMLTIMRPEDFISGCKEYDTPEELEKIYNAEYDYILYNDEPVVENIEANEYLFYKNGDFVPVEYNVNNKVFAKIGGGLYRIEEG